MRAIIEQCNVRISWEASEDNGSPIDRFLVSIKESNTEDFHSLSGLCGRVTLSRSCVVPLTILAASPFHLKYGDPITVHVAAKNSNGWGMPSPSIDYTVAMPLVPSAMEKPEIRLQSENSVEIGWEMSLNTDDSTFYELFLSNEDKGEFTKIAKTTSNFYKIEFEEDTGTIYYKLKVRTVTICGFGPFSQPLVYTYNQPLNPLPMKMLAPSTTKVATCTLKIQWHSPSPAYKFILELKDSKGLFHPLKNKCLAKNLDSCEMPMSSLDLKKGDLIQVRIAAENRKGRG